VENKVERYHVGEGSDEFVSTVAMLCRIEGGLVSKKIKDEFFGGLYDSAVDAVQCRLYCQGHLRRFIPEVKDGPMPVSFFFHGKQSDEFWLGDEAVAKYFEPDSLEKHVDDTERQDVLLKMLRFLDYKPPADSPLWPVVKVCEKKLWAEFHAKDVNKLNPEIVSDLQFLGAGFP
jgi:hypothetical protein